MFQQLWLYGHLSENSIVLHFYLLELLFYKKLIRYDRWLHSVGVTQLSNKWKWLGLTPGGETNPLRLCQKGGIKISQIIHLELPAVATHCE